MSTPSFTSTPSTYPSAMRWLHWLMAVLIVVAWFVGDWAAEQEGAAKGAAIGWHVRIASGVLLLIVLRLALRAGSRVPAAVGGAPTRALAALTHLALYGLMLALPLSGWLTLNSAGRPFWMLGLFQMPALMEKNLARHEQIENLHIWMAWGLAALVVLHVLAALKHHFIDRDGVLARMLPRLAKK